MLRYHDFRTSTPEIEPKLIQALAHWQSQRLITSHQDLYHDPSFSDGIGFLFEELYAPKDFNERDKDLERIFPKLVKLMPEQVLSTVAALVELNQCTQELDIRLSEAIFQTLGHTTLDRVSYLQGYRLCDNQLLRQRQLDLVEEVGQKLDRYARSNTILFSLKMTKGPAEMAGLSALHGFIHEGFKAFHRMQNIPYLMKTLIAREQAILNNIFSGHPSPFDFANPDALPEQDVNSNTQEPKL